MVVKQSFLSKLFRNLIKINLIPVKWDRDTNKLTFKYLSKALGIYYFYGITLLLCSCLGVYLFGFYNWIEFLKKLYFNSNVTDLITYVAFMAFVCSQLQIYPLFCKNLIQISKDIVWAGQLDWPTNGTRLLIFLVLNYLALHAWIYLTIWNLFTSI